MNNKAEIPSRAVILGLSPSGLYLAREYADAGIEVIAIHDSSVSSLYSRNLRGAEVSIVRNDDELERYLLGLEGNRTALFPTSDRYIEFITKRFTLLSRSFTFPVCYSPEHYSMLLDKERFYQTCEKAGVAYPKRIPLPTNGDWTAAVSQNGKNILSCPFIVKPARLHEVLDVMSGRKVFHCNSEDDLKRLQYKLPQDRGGWIAQEAVTGADTDIICIGGVRSRTDGSLKALIAGRKIRQFPPGFGTASALHISRNVLLPELISAAERLLRNLSLSGMFEIEFKQDGKDGVWKVFEVNPRSALWFQGARVAGVPVALQALQEDHTIAFSNEKEVFWRSGLKDLISRVYYASGRNRGRFPSPDRTQAMKAAGSRKAWAYGEPGDWRVSVIETAILAKKAARRLFKWVFQR